jgi:hypothetical protein
MNYEIIENFLEQEQFLHIQEQLMSTKYDIPWYFRGNMVDNMIDNFYFRHVIYGDHIPFSTSFDTIAKPILKKLNCISPLQIRVNLVLAQEKPFQSAFHVDKNFKCKTAIYYVNTNNGYTLLDIEKQIKVPCEANKILIFDSNIEHAMVSQTDTPRRIVVNLNYL